MMMVCVPFTCVLPRPLPFSPGCNLGAALHGGEQDYKMRTMRAIVLACVGFLGAASCLPMHSRQPQLGVAPRPHRTLHALRGGRRTSTAAVIEPPQLPMLKRTPRGLRTVRTGYTHQLLLAVRTGGAGQLDNQHRRALRPVAPQAAAGNAA